MKRSILKVLRIRELIICLHLTVTLLVFNNIFKNSILFSDKPLNAILLEIGEQLSIMWNVVLNFGTVMAQLKLCKSICPFSDFKCQRLGLDFVILMKKLTSMKLTVEQGLMVTMRKATKNLKENENINKK
jgi:hypothetical protein